MVALPQEASARNYLFFQFNNFQERYKGIAFLPPCSKGKKKNGGRRKKEEIYCLIAYVLKLTFLDISRFNSRVPSVVGRVVHVQRSPA